MTWFDLVVLSLVVYRVTRFISLDSLIEEPRNALVGWTLNGDTYIEDDHEWPMNFWKRKVLQWIECPYCQSVWVAAGAWWFWWAWGDMLFARFLLGWLAIAGACMLAYRFTDPSPPCLPTKQCD